MLQASKGVVWWMEGSVVEWRVVWWMEGSVVDGG